MIALERRRKQLEVDEDKTRLQVLREFVADQIAELAFISSNRASTQESRIEAQEVVQWLTVWRQTPELFSDWLDLRLTSPDFRKLFPNFYLEKQP